MKNNVLASTILSLAALLALTSCASGEVSAPVTVSGVSETPASESTQASAEAVQAPVGGVAVVACTILDFATLFALTSCESGESPAPVTVTATETVSGAEETPASESTQASADVAQATGDVADAGSSSDGKVGQKLVNGGVTLTVTKVEIAETIPMNRTGYETGTELGKITHERPEKGGKFLRVDTLVENTSNVSMDLTCGWVIEAKTLDSQKREFDSIDGLDYLENNPGCNDGLQPGFKADMSYVYLLPEDADATSFKFRNLDIQAETEYTTITFDQPLK
ncbi:hypothetical protein ACIPUB_00620 [Paeniglutamicibacter sp. ORCA_105]|uniref:hypothetical protein n=1 Tax=Paeniglutamicibacter sp. ORCA_105 TaxID=3377336 RepID=UPI003893F851